VPLRDFRPDLPAMREAVNDRTRLIFLAVPNSPTGTVVSRGEFEAFLRDLPRGEFVLVLDEAYREYVRDRGCPEGRDYLGENIPILVLRTFSKIYGLAGLRIGYGIGRPWLIELLNRVRPPFNVNSLAQVAAAAALRDEDHLGRSLDLAHRGIDYLTGELSSLGVEVIPSQANFVAFCTAGDARSVYEGLLRRGIIVRHLKSFGMESCIRVTVGTDEQNAGFIEALREVLRDSGPGSLDGVRDP
jgi:histidinol-phosphate aminotransferase